MINAPIVNGIWSATVTFDTGVNLVWIKAIHGSGDPACNAVLDLIFDYQPLPVCGNGLIEAGEQCDGDDAVCGPTAICSDQCLCVYQPICGNGIVDPGEQCDDGNTTNTDQCTNSCTLTFCGDGVQQNPNGQGGNERCDDGNTDNTDACTAWCMETFCGDGIVQTPNAQ